MLQDTASGVFGLSVDVRELAASSHQAALAQLLTSLRRFQIPATFATPEPGCHGLVQQLRAASPRHELAILADSTWVGAGRTHFARELASRIESAKAHRASIRTIAVTDAELTTNLDLLVKNRISVVRSPMNTGFQPQSLRYGVWQAPVGFTLPSPARWRFGGTEWAIHRALSRAARSGGFVHLVVTLDALSDPAQTENLERILTSVQRRRSKGLVAVVTMQGLVARLAPQRQSVSARSVLRVA